MEIKKRAIALLTIATLCILATTFLSSFFKTLFVGETGKMELISPGLTAILFLTYVYRKRWARIGALIVCSFSTFALIYFIGIKGFNDDKIIALSFLLLLQIIPILVLMDRAVKIYIDQAQ